MGLKESRGGPITDETTGDREGKKLAITRRIYAKSHMIVDVRVRICMSYRSAGVRPQRLHSDTAVKSLAAGREKWNNTASRYQVGT